MADKNNKIKAFLLDTGTGSGQIPVVGDDSTLPGINVYSQDELNIRVNHPSTGLLTGGEVTVGTPTGSPPLYTKINIAAGTGIVVDNTTDPINPTFQYVSWPAYSDVAIQYLATSEASAVFIDSNGSVFQSANVTDRTLRRDYILLAGLAHAEFTTLTAYRQQSVPTIDATARLSDLSDAIGPFNITGNVFGAYSTDLRISKTAGTSYQLGANYHIDKQSPDNITSTADGPISWFYAYRDGAGGYDTSTYTNTLTPALYDNGSGTLAAVSTNLWTYQLIIYFPGPERYRIEYGQATYATAADALLAAPYPNHDSDPVYLQQGIIRGYIIVRGGATDLSDSGDATFLEASKFAGSGGTIPPPTGHAYDIQTASASQTIFNVSFSFPYSTSARIYHLVYVDKVKQIEGGSYDYTQTGDAQITFNSPLTGGEVVEFYGV